MFITENFKSSLLGSVEEDEEKVAATLKDFISGNLNNVEVKDEHKVLTPIHLKF